jgi:hypothetical protein
MGLFLCDLALERARIALWRRAGFAPLAALLDASPPVPETGEAAQKSLAAAQVELAAAAKLVKDCGYHKRDAELAELQAVARGECEPADLPPRV